ncbi:DNA-binding SARP family transcriptional activator [Actinoplanes lutulentus]|nr:AAA family ATPase [Actinoplanes lutulentus]MBB2946598.1 DNA-binding SARP family transcriptional activator [Actinoplanes lutulentus]
MTVPPGVRAQILGPPRLWRDGEELDLGPRQQAYLLTLLLARAGQPVSVAELVDLMWDEAAPATALNVIHKYVGTLRRLLEPGLPVRGAASYLVRRGNAYQFVPRPGTLDLADFRSLVAAAAAAGRDDAALDAYTAALRLWQGPAGDGMTHPPAAMSIFAGLNGEFFDACVTATELAVAAGRPERVLPAVRLAASIGPLHEPVQASLITVLGAAGLRAEALSVYLAVRARLAEELGVDPGTALLRAHRRVLGGQAPPFVPAVSPVRPAAAAPVPPAGLVGRSEELRALWHLVEPALTGGTGLALVEGEPGVGKTRLLEEIAAEADRHGMLTVWGGGVEGDGTPAMWPWVQAIGAVVASLPAAARARWLTAELGRLVAPRAEIAVPDSGTQFRLFEQVGSMLGEMAAQRPVLLLIDDLQWLDTESLQLFGHLVSRLPAGVVVAGSLRNQAPLPGSELARTLAAAARVPGHRRLSLGSLGPAEVAELVRHETGVDADPSVSEAIHARTDGNPFFVRELARLLGGGDLSRDAVERAGVPSTVRDVVLDRIRGLDSGARDLLETAAIAGRDVTLGLLARAARLDPQTCLERLEPLGSLGMVVRAPGDPFVFRFAHDLVREAVAAATPLGRTALLHLAVADALEQTATIEESGTERLAYHLWVAGPLADPVRTVRALIRAGRRATDKSAFAAAERQFRSAVRLAAKAGETELELSALTQLTTVAAMQVGYVDTAPELLERVEKLARGLGREREAADSLLSSWIATSHGLRLERSAELAGRMLAVSRASADPVVRTYGPQAWGIHQWDRGDITEAVRSLGENEGFLLDQLADRAPERLRRDMGMLWPGMRATVLTMNGHAEAAQELFDLMETSAAGKPFEVTRWAHHSTTAAAMAGDASRVLRVAEKGMAAFPERAFPHVRAYVEICLWWARAVTGNDPAGAADRASAIVAEALTDPPRSGFAFCSGLVGEMWLAAGEPATARSVIETAIRALGTQGQRSAEGLLLLQRAQALAACGEPEPVVRAAAVAARTLSAERGAHLFARRADDFLAKLGTPPGM